MSNGAGSARGGRWEKDAEPRDHQRSTPAEPTLGERLAQEGREKPLKSFPATRATRTEREEWVEEARTVTFPIGLRGYERAAVDRYVAEVNRLIAEIEVSASPEAAVRRALAEVSEETREILQHAHETADEVVLRSRAKAEETVQLAEREALEISNAAQREAVDVVEGACEEARGVVERARTEAEELEATAAREAIEVRQTTVRDAENTRTTAAVEADRLVATAREQADVLLSRAQAQARELAESADSIWRERRRLIEDIRLLADQLATLAETEADRLPQPNLKTGRSGRMRPDSPPDLAAALQEKVGSDAAGAKEVG